MCVYKQSRAIYEPTYEAVEIYVLHGTALYVAGQGCLLYIWLVTFHVLNSSHALGLYYAYVQHVASLQFSACPRGESPMSESQSTSNKL